MSRCAIGAAISEIRQAETGRGLLAEYHRVLSSHTPDELPNLRKVVAMMHDDGPTLEQQICTVLIGIAARRGEPWKPILELAAPRPPTARSSTPSTRNAGTAHDLSRSRRYRARPCRDPTHPPRSGSLRSPLTSRRTAPGIDGSF